MRKQMLMLGLLLALLVLAGQHAAAEAPNVNAVPLLGLRVNGGIYNQTQGDLSLSKVSGRRAKIVVQNSFSLSLDANSAAGDQAVTSVNTSADQMVLIQVFGSSIQNASGFGLRFEYDASQVTYQGFDVGSVLPGSPQMLAEHGTNPTFVAIGIASFSGQATVSSGLVGTIRFLTTTGFSGTAVQLVRAELSRSGQSETVTLTARVELEVSTAPSPDFDGDGTVGISDFLQFVNHFGTSRGGAGYDAKYDLDGNDVIGISDFLIFVNNFGSQVPPSGGGGGGGGSGSPDLIVDSPSVSDNTLTTGQSFTLSATVRNQGTGSSAATTLRYYRSSDATISTSDTEVGTDAVGSLNSSGTSAESISLNAPSSAGTYYYGACVASVSGESNTNNNCSDGVRVTVTGTTSRGFAPADQQAFNSLVVGKRIDADTYFIDFESAGRFMEGFDRNSGRYTYSNTGANTGTLTQNYDGGLYGGRCTTQLTFTSMTTGTLRYTCDNGATGEEVRWQLSNLTTPIFARANTDTLVFAFLDTWRAGQTRAYDFQLRQKTPQGNWDALCHTYNNPSNNSVTAYATIWFASSRLLPNTTYEMRYRYRNSSSCNTGSPGAWSAISEGTTSSSGGGGGGGSPDLIVDSPSVSDNTLTTGQSFTLSATVRNQGTGSAASTTLRYYRSSNSTISTSDTEIGTDTVNGLSASGTSAESISLNAPSSAGTYYYGACVESVSGESDTGNNCSDAVSVTVAAVTPPATGTSKLYWTDWGTGKIQRSDLDGSNVEDLVSGTGLNGPDGLALDVSGGKMYWTNVGTNKIQRADLDGSNVEDLVTSGLSVPYGLALDVSGGKMYWTNRQTSKIQRADLDGSNVEDLLTLSGLAFPGELALDVSGGKMYWTNPGMDKIQRANLDGSNVEDLVASGLNSPTGLALDVSDGKMYWTDRGTHKIQRADLDGSNVEDLVASGLNTPTGLDLDVSGGKMYWTDVDADKVQRANLDGSNVEDLLTRSDGLVDPSGLAVGLIGTVSDAITGSITDCSATVDSSIYRIRITGTVQAIRPVSSLTLQGYIGSSFVGMVSLGSMSAGQTKSFTITGISGTEPSGGCRVNMEWREGGGKSQGVVNER